MLDQIGDGAVDIIRQKHVGKHVEFRIGRGERHHEKPDARNQGRLT